MHSLNNLHVELIQFGDYLKFISLNRQIYCSKLHHFRSRECQRVVNKLPNKSKQEIQTFRVVPAAFWYFFTSFKLSLFSG